MIREYDCGNRKKIGVRGIESTGGRVLTLDMTDMGSVLCITYGPSSSARSIPWALLGVFPITPSPQPQMLFFLKLLSFLSMVIQVLILCVNVKMCTHRCVLGTVVLGNFSSKMSHVNCGNGSFIIMGWSVTEIKIILSYEYFILREMQLKNILLMKNIIVNYSI